jgi:hypothetical protein
MHQVFSVCYVFTGRLVMASNTVTSSRPYWLATVSQLSPTLLTAVSRPSRMSGKLCYDGRSVGVKHPSGAHDQIFYYCQSCGFVDVGRSLWRENGSAVYISWWFSPAQSFLDPSPAGFVTIFYCLRFETPPTWRARSPYLLSRRNRVAQLYPQALGSIFVASYDSQDYGGGIRARLHAGDQSQSHIATAGPSVSKSWCRAPCGAHDQIYINLWQLRSCFCRASFLMWWRVCLLYMLLALASVVFLGSESVGTRDHILLSQVWYFLIRHLLRLAVSWWKYSTLSPHRRREITKVKVKVKVMLRPTVPSASPSWSKAPIWGLRPDIYYCCTVAGLLMWGSLSDERTGLSFARREITTLHSLNFVI